MYESLGEYSSINQEYVVFGMGGKILVIQTDTGELTYQSSEDTLVARDFPVLVFRDGSWLNFRDPNGNLVMKILNNPKNIFSACDNQFCHRRCRILLPLIQASSYAGPFMQSFLYRASCAELLIQSFLCRASYTG